MRSASQNKQKNKNTHSEKQKKTAKTTKEQKHTNLSKERFYLHENYSTERFSLEMATFFAAKYVNKMYDKGNIFCIRYNPKDEEHVECMANAPRLAANLIEDGYISEGLTVLNWVRDSDDSESINAAASWLSRDDETIVCFDKEEEMLIPEPEFFQYFRPDAREKYQRMTITELKTFLVQ